MYNINLLLDSLSNCQEAFIAISYANTLNSDNKHCVTLFIENQLLPVISPNCGIFPIEKALYSKGINIATSLSTGKYLKNCVSNKKILYIWEPEWIFSKMDYLDVYRTINSADIVISQSLSHDKCIRNISNRKSDFIIPNFDLNKIIESVK